MQEEKEFQRRIQQIGNLVQELDKIADPGVRASAKSLVQLILDLHAAGLERTLEVIVNNDEFGQRVIDDLGRDPLVSSLLVLYGLHPLDLESRIVRAVEKIAPQVRKHGGEIELQSAVAGKVRLRVQVKSQGCGSPATTLKAMIEAAMYEAAPDMDALKIEGLEDPANSSGFVPLNHLGGVGLTATRK